MYKLLILNSSVDYGRTTKSYPQVTNKSFWVKIFSTQAFCKSRGESMNIFTGTNTMTNKLLNIEKKMEEK